MKKQVFGFLHLFALHRPRSCAARLTSTYPLIVLKSLSMSSLFFYILSLCLSFFLLLCLLIILHGALILLETSALYKSFTYLHACPNHLCFLCLPYCIYHTFVFFTLISTSAFDSLSIQLILSILLQIHISKGSNSCLYAFVIVQVSAAYNTMHEHFTVYTSFL